MGLFYSETAASCVHLSVSATVEMIVSASGDIALFFVSEASASPQKPVNRAKRLKDCLWKFLQPDYGASVFGCSGCVCGSLFSLVLLCLLEMMLLLGRVCFDCLSKLSFHFSEEVVSL
ncbi:hypothetical protein DW829_10645 [Phocaeicola vulgatus]|nr:hypothetical protein DW829_10645 [Phocaeicola vulgatus]